MRHRCSNLVAALLKMNFDASYIIVFAVASTSIFAVAKTEVTATAVSAVVVAAELFPANLLLLLLLLLHFLSSTVLPIDFK